jgi:hypothetical protein
LQLSKQKLISLSALPSYLKTTLAGEPSPSPPPSPPAGEAPPPPRRKEVAFSTIVPTETCTPIVAAKGFYQLLGTLHLTRLPSSPVMLILFRLIACGAVLATRDTIAVRQPESFGEIFVALKEQPADGDGAPNGQHPSPHDDDNDDNHEAEGMDVD